jgi:hypothetical protein
MLGILTIVSLLALLVAVLELIVCHVINSISDDADNLPVRSKPDRRLADQVSIREGDRGKPPTD